MSQTEKNSVLYHLKVLYVEDEPDTREEMTKFLKRRVGKLYVAKNGLEGIAAFDQNQPHIVVTDLKMPVMDGLEMIKAIRNREHQPAIIITSALSDSETILAAVDIGIVKYVVKPIHPKELMMSMESIGKEILSHQIDIGDVNHIWLGDKEKKAELEKRIKSELAHFIKKYSGRGPKDLQVFIEGNHIQVNIFESLTAFELQLIANNRNHSLVEYNRKLFYMEGSSKIEKALTLIIGMPVTLKEVYCDCRKKIDEITFSIST
ncbi:response regulator receiver protein [Alkaliphilus metalliredigens QYMF]|uniref:Stage 0 sporulation protein A homolog n=1 Tax=Alkaliphilus metalliredigens (strain QYMF) TaxID=293826 RepID=A6TKW2_ALKMQ|nr:Na-translocating system protein MpsC family protein [Alkaliphilus metalliredigens]ABR46830.1 response regulator receiver protein [Alkaliphilus metalliredigens QYMF]